MTSTHADLVSIAHRWLTTRGACDFAFTEFGTMSTREMPDALGFMDFSLTVLIECKVSRADFLADAKKPWRATPEKGMGDWRYYMAPRGLLSVQEIPDRWGLLEVSKSGAVTLAKPLAIHAGKGKNRVSYLGYCVEQIRRGSAIQYPGCEELHARQLAEWEQIQAERWPKDDGAELALLYATARRLHVKGCWGILKTPFDARVEWKVV